MAPARVAAISSAIIDSRRIGGSDIHFDSCGFMSRSLFAIYSFERELLGNLKSRLRFLALIGNFCG